MTVRVPSMLTLSNSLRSSLAGAGEAQWKTRDTSFIASSRAWSRMGQSVGVGVRVYVYVCMYIKRSSVETVYLYCTSCFFGGGGLDRKGLLTCLSHRSPWWKVTPGSS